MVEGSYNVVRLGMRRGDLDKLSRTLPEPALDIESGSLTDEIVASYVKKLYKSATFQRIARRIRYDLFACAQRGYVIIDGLLPEPSDQPRASVTIPTAVCCLVGHPFRVIDRQGLWLDVGVDPGKEQNRFGGTGHNPFHIDVVNSTNPPDLVVLLCERKDPLGGGASLVSNMQNVVRNLSEEEVAYLERAIFRDGLFYGMSGVGEELSPFPVLEPTAAGWKIRFTAKMLGEMTDGPNKAIIEKFQQLLTDEQEMFTLERGQMVILNQNIVAHGRERLGDDQDSLPVGERRFLRQMFMRPRRSTFGEALSTGGTCVWD